MMVMAMPERRRAEMKRPDSQAEGHSVRGSKYNTRECCDCEISADLLHDPAPEKQKNEPVLTRSRIGGVHPGAAIFGLAPTPVCHPPQRHPHRRKRRRSPRKQQEGRRKRR